jgi:hypothetical protein
MTSFRGSWPKIARSVFVFCVFFLIAFGLGYPVLNRFDPRQTPGLPDVKTYAAMVSGGPNPDTSHHVRLRVLVPWIAKPFYRLSQGRLATWDPLMFSLLVANSLFVAGTAVLIVRVGSSVFAAHQLGDHTVALVGALLYLLNFAVPNLRLVGLVDAGEGFFLLALVASLFELKYWALPLIAVLGALTKESFLPFSIAFTAAWWLSTRSDQSRPQNHATVSATWILTSWVLSFAVLVGLHRVLAGTFESPLQFGLVLHHGHDYLAHFMSSLRDRDLWYIFLWLLPTAIPNIKSFPSSWLVATGATCVVAFLLDGYYGGNLGTIGRALFSIAGPLLSLSSALLVTHAVSSKNSGPFTKV